MTTNQDTCRNPHLRQDELLERLNPQAPPDDALDSGHTGVGPPIHTPGVHKPGELALGQHGVHKVKAAGGGQECKPG